MKVKEFKELISNLPDEDNIFFEFSLLDFYNVYDIYKGKQISNYFSENGYSDLVEDIPSSEHDWMISFNV